MKKQSATKGFAILSVAALLSKILSLLYIPFLLRILGDEGYGICSAAYTVYVFIYVLANSGVPVAISKMVSELSALEYYRDVDAAFKITRLFMLLVGTFLSILMLIMADKLAILVNYKKSYLSILALSPTIFFTAISSSYRGYYQGRKNMTPTAISQVMEQIANTVFTLIFAWLLLKYGLEVASAGATIGTSVGALISALYLMTLYSKNRKYTVLNDIKKSAKRMYSNATLFKKVLNYSIPITVCIGFQNLASLIDLKTTKGRLLYSGLSDSKGTAMYGYLVKYQQLINVPITIIAALSAAILPQIASAYALKNKKEIEKSVESAFRTCFLIAVPSAFGLSVLNTPIYNFIFGFSYSKGAFLMRLGAFVIVFMGIVQIQATILQSINKMYSSTLFIMMGLSLKILINYILIGKPSINIMGAIYGSLGCFILPLFINHKVLKKSLQVNFHLFKHAVKPVAAAIFMSVIAYIVWFDFNFLLSFIMTKYLANAIASTIAIFLGAFTYLYALILNGGITSEDIDILPKKLLILIPKKMLSRIR